LTLIHPPLVVFSDPSIYKKQLLILSKYVDLALIIPDFLMDVYMDAPSFSYVMINMYEKYDDVLVGSYLLFVHSDAHVKTSRSRDVLQSGAPLFVCSDVHIKSGRSREVRQSGAPFFLYVEMHV
jgi:hypothetical protein